MASVRTGGVWQQFRRLFGRGTVAGLTEAELLDRYAIGRDESAFEALVALHGPMVVGVCRRMLDDPEDVEDAFQATFLVLVRKAGALGPGVAVGPWLYGVACRVAMRARSVAARNRSRERTIAGVVEPARSEARAMNDRDEIAAALDRELAALPASYRAAVVLCDLEGRTHAEAALQLGWPIGTVKGRLARARELLRGRLARRGLAPSTAGLAAALAAEAGAMVPSGWVEIAITAARRAASGEAMAGSVSASALALAEGVLKAMRLHQWKTAAATLAATLVVAAGAGALAQRPDGLQDPRLPRRPPSRSRRPSPTGLTGVRPPRPPHTRIRPADASPETNRDGAPAPTKKLQLKFKAMDPETRRVKRGEAILVQLDQPLTMSFPQETPLEDVLKYIKSNTQSEELDLPSGIPIYVDPIGLQEAEKTLQSPVSHDLEHIPLSRTSSPDAQADRPRLLRRRRADDHHVQGLERP